MSAQAPDLKDSVVAKLVDERHAAWEADLPLGDDAALWDYLTALDQSSRLALLAHCLSFGINALHEKVNPYGALIRYTDGTPRPPARFTKKLAAWERSNGVGRLVKKEPPRVYPTWTAPASFTLHEGNFSSDGVILVTVMRSHSADSRLIFEVAEEPNRIISDELLSTGTVDHVHGQTIGFDPAADMVIVRLASNPVAGNAVSDPTSLPVYHAVPDYLMAENAVWPLQGADWIIKDIDGRGVLDGSAASLTFGPEDASPATRHVTGSLANTTSRRVQSHWAPWARP